MIIIWNAYHGTSRTARSVILASKHFNVSDKNTEWAGTGIYFFIDPNGSELALKWARYIKRFSDPIVIQAKVRLDTNQLFDLTTDEHQHYFHKMRALLYEKAIKSAVELGKRTDENFFRKINLDCVTFNSICTNMNYIAVKRKCYINFLKGGGWSTYPPSDIPNCTILCIRNESAILSLK